MPDAHRRAERAAGVTRGGLNPHLFERAFTQDAAVADTIERHAAGQAQVTHPGLLVREAGHLQHHLFGDLLDRPRQVHLPLREARLRLARRSANQRLELAAGHGQTVRVGEVFLVHPQAPIVANLDEVLFDQVDVLRLAIRRQAHHLVFAGVDPETGEVGERRIQQAQRVREAQLVQDLQIVAAAHSNRAGRPLADAVNRDHRGLLEGRREKCRRGVRFMVFAEQDRALESLEPIGDVVRDPQLFTEPRRHRHQVRPPSARRHRGVGLEQALELDERLFVERNVIQLRDGEPGLLEAVGDRLRRKRGIVLLAGEAFLLRRRDNAAVHHQARGRVVVVGGNSEDAGWQLRL